MKRVAFVFFIFVLCFLCQGNCFAALPTGQSVEDFTKSAMAEFKSVDDPQLSYAEISSRIEKYAQKMSEALQGTNIDSETFSLIMQKSAIWYGQALEGLFNGKNYDEVIQDYAGKIADLFTQKHLNLEVQERIISLTSLELENMHSFFNDLRQYDD